MRCNVCGEPARQLFSHSILRKYECAYFYCDACGFLQTEAPYWLDEAYATAIAQADTGLVQRNLQISKTLTTLLFFLFDRHGTYLDVAGGYGMLTRLMRDAGFDFYWSDKYCPNLLARGFEDVPGTVYTAVTAFEVMEHLQDPVGFISETLGMAKTRTLVFSTELFENAPPAPDIWWYYTFETGQHISFYQLRTLKVIGMKLGLKCYSNGTIHILTDKGISWSERRLLASSKLRRVLSWIPRSLMVPKMMEDHVHIMGSDQGR